MTALTFAGVTVRHARDLPPALADVSFAVAPGERIALVGTNGSGKTTLFFAAVGLLPHTGQIEVMGARLTPTSAAAVRARVGFLFSVPEDQLLLPRVVDDVAYGLSRRGVPAPAAAAAAAAALTALGVGHLATLPAHDLSHGEKQRVALAGQLVLAPDLLLLDEPSAGLDPAGRRRLAALLADTAAAMLIATHDLDFAARCCTRYLVLESGRLVCDTREPAAARHRLDPEDGARSPS